MCLRSVQLAFLCVVALAKRKAQKPIYGRVLTLTGEPYMGDDAQHNFGEVLEARPIVVVNFVVDCIEGTEGSMTADMVQQCKTCRSFKPAFKHIAKENIAMTFGELDVEAEEALATKFGATLTPKLVLFLNGTASATYSGEFTFDKVLDWLARAARLSQPKSEYDLGKLISSRAKGDTLVVARGTAQVGHYLAETNAQIFKDDRSVHMHYAFLAAGENIFSLELHRGVNEKAQFEFVQNSEIFAEDFVAFVRKEKTPSFGVITADNVRSLVDSSQDGFVLLCLPQTSLVVDAEKLAATFKKLAKKFKKFRFVCGDTSQGYLAELIPNCEEFPSVIFKKGDKIVKKVFEATALDDKSVSAFLKESLNVQNEL